MQLNGLDKNMELKRLLSTRMVSDMDLITAAQS